MRNSLYRGASLFRLFSTKANTKPDSKNTKANEFFTSESVRKSKYLEFHVTADLYRVDVGFLLMRPPIIDDVSEAEIKRRIALHKLKKASNLYPKIDDSLYDFEIKDPLEDLKGKDRTYKATHEKRVSDGNTQYYHRFSKDINHIDLEERNPKSIQVYPKHTVYLFVKDETGNWTIPNKMVEHNLSLGVCVERLKSTIFGQEIIAPNVEYFPTFTWLDKVPEEEIKENKLMSKLKGRKIFIFKAIHNTGRTELQLEKHFKEYQWVPKPMVKDFVSKENYERMIDSLTL